MAFLDAATQAAYADYAAILIILSQFKTSSDPTAKGLLHEIRTTKFL